MTAFSKNENTKYHRTFAVIFALLAITAGIYLLYQRHRSEIPGTFDLTKTNPNNGLSLQASKPINIKISSINVNATVSTLGLNPDKTLEVPSNYSEVGWYTGSPTPGEIGPAVMVGHLDSAKAAAVFFDLKRIKANDIIEIQRQDGSTAKFRVDSMQTFSQDNFPTEKVYGPIDYSGLRLITCAGTYERLKGHYSDNLVVFARLIN